MVDHKLAYIKYDKKRKKDRNEGRRPRKKLSDDQVFEGIKGKKTWKRERKNIRNMWLGESCWRSSRRRTLRETS